tara:strand:+ start:392 stop:544 length:153 start_codon:yes stop_codon:yes gene_type:complete
MKLPLETFIFVKVNGSIKNIIEPKLENTAISIANNINGMYRFLVSFNLII